MCACVCVCVLLGPKTRRTHTAERVGAYMETCSDYFLSFLCNISSFPISGTRCTARTPMTRSHACVTPLGSDGTDCGMFRYERPRTRPFPSLLGGQERSILLSWPLIDLRLWLGRFIPIFKWFRFTLKRRKLFKTRVLEWFLFYLRRHQHECLRSVIVSFAFRW